MKKNAFFRATGQRTLVKKKYGDLRCHCVCSEVVKPSPTEVVSVSSLHQGFHCKALSSSAQKAEFLSNYDAVGNHRIGQCCSVVKLRKLPVVNPVLGLFVYLLLPPPPAPLVTGS